MIYICVQFFQQRIAHGGFIAGLFSTVLGTILPGLGTIYLRQDSKFVKPVFIGDTVSIKVEVASIDEKRNRVKKNRTATNQHGQEVVIGEAIVMPPKKENEHEQH